MFAMIRKRHAIVWIIIILLLTVGLTGYLWRGAFLEWLFRPTPTLVPNVRTVNEVPADDIKIVAENLNIPWEIVFLPDKSMLVTERPGTIVKITTNQQKIPVDGVAHSGEGGLLGLAIHPHFSDNQLLYIYLTTETTGTLVNRVEQYRLVDNHLVDRTVVLDGIPGSSIHDGGRLAFGPDGSLYISTGDAGREEYAQDQTALGGKILRIRSDGGIPTENPFGNAVYTYGHRNVQGLAWDDTEQLWATEHGPSGLQTGFDEVNRINPGGNYGWPTIRGGETHPNMITPIINSGNDDTWAPSGMAFWHGKLYFAGLRGQAIYEIDPRAPTPQLRTYFKADFGRIRSVVVGPDDALYIATNNTDGRGTPKNNDDQIIRIARSAFE